ncbi:MAG: ABC transporter substrate-binding protein [Candidatus Dormibacteraeota bacterium]|nr:ABC transporter substrate-binding protein [Candidatus Dormibacteraeota bacterium]
MIRSAAVSGVLVLAACGSSGGSSGSSSSGGGTGPITMAMVGPLTGSAASQGIPILEGAKAATKYINDNGGILGRTLTLDQVDTVGDPADAVPALNKEIPSGNPVALIGPITLEIKALQPIFDRNHIVDGFNGGSVQYDTNTDNWLWRCNASDSELGVAMALEAYKKGYRNAALFVSNSSSTETLIPVIQKAFKALGGTIAGTVTVSVGQPSYLSEVQQVVNLHPDVIFTQMEPNTGSVAVANFQEINNLSIPFIGTDLTAGSDFVTAINTGVAHAHFISVEGSNALTSSGQTFTNVYQQVNGHPPLAASGYAYDCVVDFALAMTKAGTSDPNVWVNDITAVSNPPGTQVGDYKQAVAMIKAGTKIDYAGASGPMDFDKYHNVTGAWDVVQATGDAAGTFATLETLQGTDIQAVINKESTG